MREIQPIITGTEMEWSPWTRVLLSQDPTPLVNHGGANQLIRDCLPDYLARDHASGMTSNGARIYADLGFIEGTTPEDDSISGTITNELAGERNVLRMLDNAVENGRIVDYSLHKRVLSDDGATLGYHTSFAVDGRKISIQPEVLLPVAMHLATQNIYAGAGAIWRHSIERPEQPAIITLAQKVLNLNVDYAMSSHGRDQPLVSMRDEPLASERHARVHLTSMDANISPWATKMRLGTTSIVLRLMMGGYRGEDIQLDAATPMHMFARSVAHDLDMKETVKLERGKRARALDIQRALFEHAALISLTTEEQGIMKEWKRALDDLEEDPERLGDRADWVIRRKLIRRTMEKKDVPLDSHDASVADRSYDLLDERRGVGMILRKRGVLRQWMPDEAAIEQATHTPPQTTRAKTRGALIKQYHDDGTMSSNWEYVRFGKPPHTVNMRNPYQAEYDAA